MAKTITITQEEYQERLARGVKEALERQKIPNYVSNSGSNSRNTRIDLNTPKGKALAFARACHILGHASIGRNGADFDHAAKVANQWKEKSRSEVDEMLVSVMKSGSLQAQDFASAGIFVDIEDTKQIIEYLRAKAVVRNLPGIEKTNFVNGGRTIKISSTDVSVDWIGAEGDTAALSDRPKYGSHTMRPRKMGARMPVGNDLLRRTTFDISEEILNKFVGKISQTEDIAFLRGDGSENTPKGLLYWCASENKFNANATVNAANIDADITKAMTKLNVTDIPESNRSWLMNPRVSSHLAGLRDANGIKWFPEMSNSVLGRNNPVFDTNNIPRNLGGGTASELYYVEGANIIIADELEMQTIIDQNSYKDSNGDMLSPADRDETVFRMFHSTDIMVRYATGIVIIEAVLWGA